MKNLLPLTFRGLIGISTVYILSSLLSAGWVKPAVAYCGDGIVEGPCPGDCNTDGIVTVDEILFAVSRAIILVVEPTTCLAGDVNHDGQFTVDEILMAVTNALDGCSQDEIEDCDDGGTCASGENAGAHCDSEDQCPGNGICTSGRNHLRACFQDSDCQGGGLCERCRPMGGDGCAANCSDERVIELAIVPGAIDRVGNLLPTTSGIDIETPSFPLTLPINARMSLTIGEERFGEIPYVTRGSDQRFPAIAVGALACACVRQPVAMTCGGTMFEVNGSLSTDCTPEYTEGEVLCDASRKPCAFVHGEGNSGSGIISCSSLSLVNVNLSLDCNSRSQTLETSLGGAGGSGSALLFTSMAISSAVGDCNGNESTYGPDGLYCTDDDDASLLGSVLPIIFTTGVVDVHMHEDFFFFTDPPVRQGHPFFCAALIENRIVGNPTLVGGFAACELPTIGMIKLFPNFVLNDTP